MQLQQSLSICSGQVPTAGTMPPLGSQGTHREGEVAESVGTPLLQWVSWELAQLTAGPLSNSSPAFLSNEALIGSRLCSPQSSPVPVLQGD